MRIENKMLETGNYNCFEYMCAATEKWGDYDAAQHMDLRVKRSEFIRDVEALAYYLKIKLGLKKGDSFTVFCPTNIESLVAFYAFSKIGVIGNFVHPLLPTSTLLENMKEANSKGVIILDLLSKDHIKAINKTGLPVILLRCSDYASPIKKKATRLGEAALEGIFPKFKNAVAYEDIMKDYAGKKVIGEINNANDVVVYLNGGGTTGKSKTIKLTNKALNELVYKMGYIDEIQIPGEEAEIIILPFFHALGLGVTGHMVMCNAARIIPLMQFDAKLVVKLYKQNKIVGIGGIPNMFKKLYNAKGFDGPHLADTRMMFVGGDDLSPAFLDAFNDMLDRNGTKARLRQGYGLTEVASACSTNTNWENKDGSIGKPLYGIRMEIWDDNHKKLPNGEIGEIVISGSTLMEGYLTENGKKDEGLYYDEEGTPWVLSGDLGYCDDDGYFFFSGRKKRVVIISGYNIYPVDIENLMDTLPFIKESCAVQGYTEEGKPLVRLYASIKFKGDEEEYKETIRKLCAEKLSQFSVPREIVFMDELPHTPLEKVDFMKLTQKKPQ